jgi:hypothetical protein
MESSSVMSGPVWAGESITNAVLSAIASSPSPDKKITKLQFAYNADGSVNTIQFYSGSQLLFTLTFSYSAGSVVTISRS